MSIELDIAVELGLVPVWSIDKMINTINNEYALYLVAHSLSEEDANLLEQWYDDTTMLISTGDWWINEHFFKQDVFGIVLRKIAQWQKEDEGIYKSRCGDYFDLLFEYLGELKDPSYYGEKFAAG